MKNITHCIFIFVVILGFFSCQTFQIPKDYLPDSKLVYLTQNTSLTPIIYEPLAADPYIFKPSTEPLKLKPEFLTTLTWTKLLIPDFQADYQLFREVEAYFKEILNDPVISELENTLDSTTITASPELTPDKGELLETYTNGGLYKYPGIDGAQIKILNGGYYEIAFPDKGYFRHQSDGSYERGDGNGSVIFGNYPKQSQIVTTINGNVFRAGPHFKEMKSSIGTISYIDQPQPQYKYSPGNSNSLSIIFFVDENKKNLEITIFLTNDLRIDYFPHASEKQQMGVLFTHGDQAVFIDQQYRKVHQKFDLATRTTTNTISLYYPEGIRLTNLSSGNLAYGEVNAFWPENYKKKSLGLFDLLYTSKDESLISKIQVNKLIPIEENVRKLTGLLAANRRTLIIPPDLDSYRKLNAILPGQVINWYPSGFETKDIIVMWPLSVPRYKEPAGQDYYIEKEFYEILAHEYVHVLVGENTGIINPVPVWLNEGLAVYVEAQFIPEVKNYWNTTFKVSQGLKRLLDWDLVTTTGTGELDLSRARIHYAQSYAFVSTLEKTFGPAKVADYIKSFKIIHTKDSNENLKLVYKINFKKIFGIDFDEALKLLDSNQTKE